VTPPPHAAGVWKRVPDAVRVAVRPIDYARNDERRGASAHVVESLPPSVVVLVRV
jgi:hypothetical protein